jgi:aminoglycoside 6'-N-acetyltransferase I
MPEVRPLRPDDRAQWLELRRQLHPDYRPDVHEDEIAEVLNDPLEAGFGAFEGDDLIGFIEVSERPWGEGCETAPVGWIENLLVVPYSRLQGIGRRLVDATANWSRTRGLSELGSDVVYENETSLITHQRWGFEETMRLVMFRKRL